MSNAFTPDATDEPFAPYGAGIYAAPAEAEPATSLDPYPGHDDLPPRRRKRRRLRIIVLSLVLVVALAAVSVVLLGPFSPLTTAKIAAQDGPAVHHDVSIDHISRYLLTAIVLDEDQDLRTRESGPDWGTYITLAERTITEHKIPEEGASTIPQQLAKNLYLFESDNPFLKVMRKIVEAPMAEMLARGLSKKRLLEIYSNAVQFGPTLFGVCAAAWYYFASAPWDLSPYQATQLAAILPLPDLAVRVAKPEGGIYINVDPKGKQYARFHEKIANRTWWTPTGDNSYSATMAAVGITDEASDHVDTRATSDSCSTMPPDVQQLLTANGY